MVGASHEVGAGHQAGAVHAVGRGAARHATGVGNVRVTASAQAMGSARAGGAGRRRRPPDRRRQPWGRPVCHAFVADHCVGAGPIHASSAVVAAVVVAGLPRGGGPRGCGARILEPLKEAVLRNLSHRHSYVRRNAVMCVYSIARGPSLAARGALRMGAAARLSPEHMPSRVGCRPCRHRFERLLWEAVSHRSAGALANCLPRDRFGLLAKRAACRIRVDDGGSCRPSALAILGVVKLDTRRLPCAPAG